MNRMQIFSAENFKFMFNFSDQTVSSGFIEEIVREQVWSAAIITRRLLLSRVQDSCDPLVPVKKEALNQIIDSMLQKGDLLAGNGGYMAAAPLRIVECGSQLYRVFGTLPGKYLKQIFEHRFDHESRIIRDSEGELVKKLLDKFNGMLLSPERWACLDRICTGENFLKSLDERLALVSDSGSLSAYETVNDWQMLMPSHGKSIKSSWKKAKQNESGLLWRGWTQFRKPVFAWSAGTLPEDGKWLRLNNDEATRAGFALFSKAGVQVNFSCKKEAVCYALELEEFLPVSEYRFLLALSEPEIGEHRRLCYSEESLNRVQDLLQENLDIKVIIDEGEKP